MWTPLAHKSQGHRLFNAVALCFIISYEPGILCWSLGRTKQLWSVNFRVVLLSGCYQHILSWRNLIFSLDFTHFLYIIGPLSYPGFISDNQSSYQTIRFFIRHLKSHNTLVFIYLGLDLFKNQTCSFSVPNLPLGNGHHIPLWDISLHPQPTQHYHLLLIVLFWATPSDTGEYSWFFTQESLLDVLWV